MSIVISANVTALIFESWKTIIVNIPIAIDKISYLKPWNLSQLTQCHENIYERVTLIF